MTVYDLIKELSKFPPDSEVFMIDGGEEVEVLSVGDSRGEPIIKSWENVLVLKMEREGK